MPCRCCLGAKEAFKDRTTHGLLDAVSRILTFHLLEFHLVGIWCKCYHASSLSVSLTLSLHRMIKLSSHLHGKITILRKKKSRCCYNFYSTKESKFSGWKRKKRKPIPQISEADSHLQVLQVVRYPELHANRPLFTTGTNVPQTAEHAEPGASCCVTAVFVLRHAHKYLNQVTLDPRGPAFLWRKLREEEEKQTDEGVRFHVCVMLYHRRAKGGRKIPIHVVKTSVWLNVSCI